MFKKFKRWLAIKLRNDEPISQLKPYEVYEYDWGTAIKHRKGKWETLFIRPDAQEIDVTHLNVRLHDNGIEFL